MNLTLAAFEAAIAAGTTTPAMREAVAAYREVCESIARSVEKAVDKEERETLLWLLWCVDLQGEARVKREAIARKQAEGTCET